MPHPPPDGRIADLARALRARGVVLTAGRRAILGAVLASDEHPSAERVQAILRRRRVRVSRATVFRTLEAFARMGILDRVSHSGSSVRYDGRADRHHHLVCTRCDRIVDFTNQSLDAMPVPDTGAAGFTVTDLRVQLRGICRSCRQQEDKR
jgi:Fur family peroxide stress response transcriptional regulator